MRIRVRRKGVENAGFNRDIMKTHKGEKFADEKVFVMRIVAQTAAQIANATMRISCGLTFQPACRTNRAHLPTSPPFCFYHEKIKPFPPWLSYACWGWRQPPAPPPRCPNIQI
jgi:hypothetical protein